MTMKLLKTFRFSLRMFVLGGLLITAAVCINETYAQGTVSRPTKTHNNGNSGNSNSTNNSKSKPPKKKQSSSSSLHLTYDNATNSIVYGNHSYKMVYISGGSFDMGATPEQVRESYSNEKPVHKVILSSYRIGATEVPQWLWVAIMGNNPSHFEGDNLPVENVSWNDCRDFISRLNSLTGKNFHLPTEAQWEYAARGGSQSTGYKYSGSDNLDAVAWYDGNSGGKTHPVATKNPNELGLYDMSGNVWEWCRDLYGNYDKSSQTDPIGPSSGSYRVDRSGSWISSARLCRISNRYNVSPGNRDNYLGFRLAL